ncbi:MAG TPA: amino acid adenylation domain-containing protein [Blastocatellia bacterium]|nr:amino acid adenylation domain-containing protein [Blastocatellia bacterium]
MQSKQATGEDVFVFPTSFGQQRLWFLEQLNPGSPVHNVPAAARLSGRLDFAAMEAALVEIIGRHEVIRTSFSILDGEPVQVIGSVPEFRLTIIDLGGMPADRRERELSRLAFEEAQRPFDLSGGLLFRASLVRLSDAEHVLLLTLHHVVSDGWSLGVLVREIVELYGAFRMGRPSPLPDLPIQYADFACWQRDRLQSEVLQSDLSYWERQLSGSLPVLDLPTDHPRGSTWSSNGAAAYFSLPESLTGGLKDLSRREGATLFMTLLAAFQSLLHRYTGQEDILVGTPIANRNRPELERLIGLFINNLIIRADLSGNPSFKELLARVRKVALEAYAHQDLPFEKLVEQLQPERNLSHTPLFQVLFALQNSPAATLELPGLSTTLMEIHNGTAKFDLALLMEEKGGGLQGLLEYNTGLFREETIQRMIGHFRVLLEGVLASPDTPVSQLPLLTGAERGDLLTRWSQGPEGLPESDCIHRLFEQAAARAPGSVAVFHEGEQLSYGELNAKANRLAHYLRELGVGPDILVGLCMDRSVEMIVGMLGILKAGGAYVPVDPMYPADRIAFMLDDARAPVIVTRESLSASLPQGRARLVCLDSQAEMISERRADNPAVDLSPDNLAYVIYTSGSTGRPKGTMIQHGSLVNYTRTAIEKYGVEPEDRVLQFCSISFDISVEEIFPCLARGAALVLRSDSMLSSAPIFLEKCRQWGLTMLSLPTAYWHELTAGLGEGSPPLPPALRMVIIAGERAMPERVRSWLMHVDERPRLINTYGLTESTVVSTMCELTRASVDVTREVPIGLPIRSTQVYILDKHLEPTPIGVPGELYIGGLLLARGYFNRPEVTAERFLPDPYSPGPGARLYRTGDLARFLDDGNIEFMGRADHQVKIRGFRIELGEVETAMAQHPSVRECVVVAREETPGHKRLVAYVVSKQEEVNFGELRGFLHDRLPEYMVPSAFVPMDALPLSPNGKIDRGALPAPESNRPQLGVEYTAPRDEIEGSIAAIWQEVLKVEKVGAHDNFFDLGGHSLLMVQAQTRLSSALKRDISMMEMFQYSTVSSLASYLKNAGGESQADQHRPERSEEFREPMRRRREARLKHRALEASQGGQDE